MRIITRVRRLSKKEVRTFVQFPPIWETKKADRFGLRWIGDWLNYGKGRWGEMYSQAFQEETGFREQTLTNDKYIAGRIEFSRRRENLSFAHHAEIAPLPPEAQDRWLDIIERDGLPTRRAEINPPGFEE